MRYGAGLIAIAAVSASMVSACHKPAEMRASDAWVRLPAVPGHPGAAYFTLQGGPAATTLTGVSAPFALHAELHESAQHNGVMSMARLHDVAVPAGATIAFAPGGRHVMLFDIGPNVHAGEQVPLTLEFDDGGKVTVQARVVAAGDPAPK